MLMGPIAHTMYIIKFPVTALAMKCIANKKIKKESLQLNNIQISVRDKHCVENRSDF